MGQNLQLHYKNTKLHAGYISGQNKPKDFWSNFWMNMKLSLKDYKDFAYELGMLPKTGFFL